MDNDPVRKDEIRQALQRVLSSSGFSRNERLSGFLRFLVERHLEGRDSELKESVIAHEVFGRQPDYDPKVDPTVRTEAIRLRARLEKYYQGEGFRDSVVIELPKGGYRPVIRNRTVTAQVTDTEPRLESRPSRVSRPPLLAGILITIVLATIAGLWWSGRLAQKTFTIAVLPLENVGADPANDYFADGLTDEIIHNLSMIEGASVPSRTSSFALKGKGLNAVESGSQLGAEYLVEGSVFLAGEQLRVTVALIRARDEVRLWSDRFDRKLSDVFAIQDEISRGVANALRLRLTGRRRYEANLEAYDLYLRGRQIMAGFPSRTRPVVEQALEYFQRAIDKDPNYAIAWAGMADTYVAVERNIGARNPIDAWRRAKEAAARAIDLDPMLSEAQSAMASVRAREYAWADAERGLRRAIELNPNNSLAHLELGARVFVAQGRFDEGLEAVGRALALDPLSPFVTTDVGEALLLARRYAEATERFRRAIALDPTRSRPYNWAVRALYLQGKIAEARETHDHSVKLAPVLSNWVPCLEVRANRREAALALLADLRSSGRPARAIAFAHACLGDREQALEFLGKAVTENEPGLPALLQAPELDFVRSDPRFAALRKRVNLAQ